ncbi:MAG TPA: histidine phosphatase family protein [Clostridiales bacterium]|nr:histidine phosphatase family protein [Clostridiales bacterium]HPP35526.1 histidine phosphatase family protein [Clostridiales bacterium]
MNALIHIIRHGRTFANTNGLYCGSTDVSLSETGIREILEYKEKGIYPEAELFITSGLKRTAETLRLIYGDVDYITVAGLREYNFGEFEMHSHYELEHRNEYQAWITDEAGDVCCPCGESRIGFCKRVEQGINDVLDEMERRRAGSAAVICHGGVIMAIMHILFPGERNYYEWQPDNGLGYTLQYSDGNFSGYRSIDPCK